MLVVGLDLSFIPVPSESAWYPNTMFFSSDAENTVLGYVEGNWRRGRPKLRWTDDTKNLLSKESTQLYAIPGENDQYSTAVKTKASNVPKSTFWVLGRNDAARFDVIRLSKQRMRMNALKIPSQKHNCLGETSLHQHKGQNHRHFWKQLLERTAAAFLAPMQPAGR